MTTYATAWHRWVLTSDDDTECSRPGCGVIVSDDALHLVSIGCPVPLCTAPANEGCPCIIAPGDRHPECSYCRRPAVLDAEDDGWDDDDPDDDGGAAEILVPIAA